jgi:hypothetical protein
LLCGFHFKKFSQENGSENHQEKGEKKIPTGLSPRKGKACHRVSTALLQSVAKIDPKHNEEQQKGKKKKQKEK